MIIKLVIKKAKQYLKKHGRTAKFEAFENLLCKTHNAKLIYEYAKNVCNADVEKCVQAISETNNAEYIYLTALFFPDIEITALQNAIINTKNGEYIYKFSCFIKGADQVRLHHSLLKTKNAKFIHKLAHYFDTVNILEIEHAMKKYANKKELENFYNDSIINKKLKKHKQTIIYNENSTIIKNLIKDKMQLTKISQQPISITSDNTLQNLENDLSFLSEEDRAYLLELEQAFTALTRPPTKFIMK